MGSVEVLLEHRINANIKLFHEKINARIPAVRMPGLASGIIILVNTWKFDEPSIRADSSSSFGIVSKYGIMIQMIVGSETIKWQMISDV